MKDFVSVYEEVEMLLDRECRGVFSDSHDDVLEYYQIFYSTNDNCDWQFSLFQIELHPLRIFGIQVSFPENFDPKFESLYQQISSKLQDVNCIRRNDGWYCIEFEKDIESRRNISVPDFDV